MHNLSRLALATLSAPLALALAGFAEDSTARLQQKSTTHFDLMYSLSRCFGQSIVDSQTIANYSQATDAGQFNSVSVDFTSRAGANAAYFHVAQLVPGAVSELGTWSDPAKLGTGYVPAGLPQPTAQTASLAGTLGAFGIYLHAVGDSYSHKACTDHQYVPHCGAPGTPAAAAFHVCANETESLYCDAPGAHVDEYGADPALTDNTKAGLRAMYAAMAQRFHKSAAIPAAVATLLDSFATEMDAGRRESLAASIPVGACNVAP